MIDVWLLFFWLRASSPQPITMQFATSNQCQQALDGMKATANNAGYAGHGSCIYIRAPQ